MIWDLQKSKNAKNSKIRIIRFWDGMGSEFGEGWVWVEMGDI